jgi:hypothetical protein
MKYLLASLILLLALTGCASKTAVPVAMKFPAVPQELMQSCPDLEQVDPKTDKLSDVLTVVTDNYMTYYQCKSTVDDWIEWYNTQKTIFDKVTK